MAKIKKNKVGRLILLDFKMCYNTIVNETMWHWHRDRHIDQWKRTENLEINPPVYGQMLSTKGAKIIQQRRFSSTNGVWKTEYLHAKE